MQFANRDTQKAREIYQNENVEKFLGLLTRFLVLEYHFVTGVALCIRLCIYDNTPDHKKVQNCRQRTTGSIRMML